MSKYILYIFSVLSILIFVSFAYSLPTGMTGKTSQTLSTGCGTSSCHGNQSTSTVVSVSGPSNVLPGSNHSYTVTVTNSAQSYAGCDIGVKTTLNGETSIGTLTPGTNMWFDNATGEITHSSPHAMSSGSCVFNFSWTAPNTNGTYFMRATGNAVNGDGTNSGDLWKFGTPLTIVVTNVVTQTLSMGIGWNTISTNLIPNSNILDTLFSSIRSNITIIKDGSGNFYVPSLGINTIGNWSYLKGYMIYLTQQSSLNITGTYVTPQTTNISLQTGWNLIPYLRNSAMRIDSALTSINSRITIVKNNGGNIYVPSFGINTIGNMLPGQGYMVYLSQASTLNYPAN